MANNTRAKLDTLPVELLQRIAGFLPCSSALNLLRVNRALHDACDDRLLFKCIAQTSHLAVLAQKWDSDAILEGKSLIETKEIALAVEKAANWYADSKNFEIDEMEYRALAPYPVPLENPTVLKRFRCWLPQLVALHHPCALQVNHEAFWQHLDQFRGSIQHQGFPSLSFSFIAPILEQNAQLDRRDSRSVLGLSLFLARAIEGLKDMPFVRLYRSNPGFGDEISNFLDIFPYHYSMAIILQYVFPLANASDQSSRTRFPLPLPSKISFPSFMDIPRLMHDCEDGEDLNIFPSFDSSAMIAPGLMCSGEWGGYYSYDRQAAATVVFDPPMHSIHFSTRQDDGQTVLENTTGVDSIGSFTLRGTLLEAGTGRTILHMTKTYTTAFDPSNVDVEWEWRAWVTPFGIVGVWGQAEPDLLHGHFWLWKREWTHEPESSGS